MTIFIGTWISLVILGAGIYYLAQDQFITDQIIKWMLYVIVNIGLVVSVYLISYAIRHGREFFIGVFKNEKADEEQKIENAKYIDQRNRSAYWTN